MSEEMQQIIFTHSELGGRKKIRHLDGPRTTAVTALSAFAAGNRSLRRADCLPTLISSLLAKCVSISSGAVNVLTEAKDVIGLSTDSLPAMKL